MQHLCTTATLSLKNYMSTVSGMQDHVQEVLYIAT